MQEEQSLEVAKLIDKAVENKKRNAWGGFGVELYHGEISLQLKAQAIANKLLAPKTSDIIGEAESALATVKAELNELIEERKKITGRFTSVVARLMEPEKSIDAAIKENTAAIIKAKQTQREELKLVEDKAKELKAIAEHVRLYVADMHAAYLKAHATLISTAYKHALKQEIPVAEINTYIDKVCTRVNLKNTVTPAPKPQFKYNTQQDVDAEVLKHFNPWEPKKYVEGFRIDVQNKFDDWDLALKNKDQAEKLDTDELNLTIDAIADNKEKETVAAKLETLATEVLEQPTSKELKQVYKIVEPETMEEAHNIINAYIVNKWACQPYLRKIKPVNFGVEQMMRALEGIKNNDNAFNVTGIKFQLVDKL